MNAFYLVLNKKENDKYVAFMVKCCESNNLLSVLMQYSGLSSVNICKTHKQAQGLVDFWNEGYKENGTYLIEE